MTPQEREVIEKFLLLDRDARQRVLSIIIQQAENEMCDHEEVDALGWPVGFFERTYGSLADDPR